MKTSDDDFRPTWIDEVAARIMAALAGSPKLKVDDWALVAEDAYNAAEALIAEGRRRRGNGE